ncbi:hypothetical protein E3V39_06965 [Gammaproteobacteria bacterium LSUCC0112]|nr:hypothetical protein E3V39_06965 [Gammaproteobacteria bacterium LSUCC0112]
MIGSARTRINGCLYQNVRRGIETVLRRAAAVCLVWLLSVTMVVAQTPLPGPVQLRGTGGTVTTSGNYVVHTFTGNGTFVAPPGVTALEVLVVGGGGGGGAGGTIGAGGGGAGGAAILRDVANPLTITQGVSITVNVGGGGGGGANGAAGGSGTASSLVIGGSPVLTANGGGGGGGGASVNGVTGANGGGAAAGEQNGNAVGTVGQPNNLNGFNGFAGGAANGAGGGNEASRAGGGGGGATQAGLAGTTGAGGQGGNGLATDIRGTTATYAAGGGGGAVAGGLPGASGAGAGNGGATPGGAATANTGSGGGGARSASGGAGGSGIVVIRYLPANLTVTQQPSAFMQSGVVFDVPAQVRVLSNANLQVNPSTGISGVQVTATLATGPGLGTGILANNVVTTDSNGFATFTNLTLTAALGNYSLVFTVAGDSNNFVVSQVIELRAPSAFFWAIDHPLAYPLCVASVPITFTIQDQYGNIDTDYTGTVRVTSSVAAGSYTVAVGNGTPTVISPGVIDYPIQASDNGTFTLNYTTTAGATRTFNATSGGNAIQRDPDYALTMQVGDCSFRIQHDGTAGTCAAEPITVRVVDLLGNNVVDYAGTMTLTGSRTTNPSPGPAGSWSNIFGGLGTFSNNGTGVATYTFSPGGSGDEGEVSLGYSATTAGTYTFTVSAGNVSTTSFNSGNLALGACKFRVSYPDGSANGVCVPARVAIEVLDNNDNLVLGFNGLVTISTQGNTRGNWGKTDISDPEYALGTLTPGAPNTGNATYTFDPADGGRIRLNFSIDVTGSINFNLSATGVSNPSGGNDPSITFSACQFRITHSGSSDVCSIEQVTIALFNGANPVTNYTGTINLSTTTGFGSWAESSSSQGVLIDPVDGDGNATYEFVLADAGSVVLDFRHSANTGLVNINVSDGVSLDARNSGNQYDLNISIGLCTVRINHEVNSNACSITDVTFAVYDSNNALAQDYLGTLRVSNSSGRGDWLEDATANGVISAPSGADVGIADYVFSPDDNGQVVLGFYSTTPGTINFNVQDGLIIENGSFDPNLILAGCFPQISTGPVCTNPGGPGTIINGTSVSLGIPARQDVAALRSRMVLMATMQVGVSSDATTATFNGNAMTRVHRQYNATPPGVTTEIWAILDAQLPVSAGNYTGTFSGGVGSPSICMISVSGLAQEIPTINVGDPESGPVNGSNNSNPVTSGRHNALTRVTSSENNSFVISVVTNDRATNADLTTYFFRPPQPFTTLTGLWGGRAPAGASLPLREDTLQANPINGKTSGSTGVLSAAGLLEVVEPFEAVVSPPNINAHALATFKPLVAGPPQAENFVPVTLYETFAGNMSYRAIGASLRSLPSPANLSVNPAEDCAMYDFATGTTATLDIPAGATLTAAYLYWAGSGTAAQADTQITFGPAAQAGSPVVAAQVFTATGLTSLDLDFFGAYAEVTSLITSLSGDYRVKDLTVQNGSPWTGNGTCAGGWSLVAIYEHPNEQLRVVNLFHGFQPFQYGAFTLTPRNFRMATYTPQFNLPNGQVTHFTIEGDEQLFTGDESLQIQSAPGQNTYTAIPNSFNPSGSEFNSTITAPIYALRTLPVIGDVFVFDPVQTDPPLPYALTPPGINGDGYQIFYENPGFTPSGNRIGDSWGVDIDTHYLSDQLLQPFAIAPNEAERITTRYSSGQDAVILISEVISVTNYPLADIEVFITQSGTFKVGGTGAYQIQVTNNGNGATLGGGGTATGEIVVAMRLPAGMTFANSGSVSGGADWSCTVSLGTVDVTPGAFTCVYIGSTPFSAQTNLPFINANAVVGGPTSFPLQSNTTKASVRVQHSGGACAMTATGFIPDPALCQRAPQFDNRNDLQGGTIDINNLTDKTTNNNNVHSINTTVTGRLTNLRMQKALVGNLEVGSTTAQYLLTVTNLGPDDTNQTITVTDTQPSGVTFTAATGTGWVCGTISPVLNCTFAGTLANNASTAITLTATVTGGAGFTVTNTAQVTGGNFNFDTVPSNNAATTINTIIGAPVSSQERFLLSVSAASGTTAIGGISGIANDDLFVYDPATDEAFMFFDDVDNNAGRINEIDAVHLLRNGHIVMSAGATSTIGSNDIIFQPEDLVRYDPILGVASLFLDGSATIFNTHTVQNITSVHVLDDCNPNLPLVPVENGVPSYKDQCSILFSTANGGFAGTNGLEFTSSDIVKYDRITGLASIYLDGSTNTVFGNQLVDIDAFYQRVNLTDDNAVIAKYLLSVDDTGDIVIGNGLTTPTTGTIFTRDDVTELDLVGSLTRNLFVGDQELGVFEPTEIARSLDALHLIEDGYFGHFSIVQDQGGNLCEAGVIRITKHRGLSHVIDTTYTGSVSIDITASNNTGTAVWQLQDGDGTLVDLGGGDARYTFVPSDAGVVILRLAYDEVSTININVSNGIARETPSEDPTFNYNALLTPIYYTDFFDTQLLSNSDGNLNWTASWVEIDGATGLSPGISDGLSTGNVQVVSNRLRMRNNANSIAQGIVPTMSRVVNLEEGTGSGQIPYGTQDVILQVNVSHTAITPADSFLIQARGSNSNSWVTLENFNATLPDTSNSSELKQYNLSAIGQPLTNTAEIRFRMAAGFDSDNRYFYINDVSISTNTEVCGYSTSSDLDHYAINHAGAGIACVGTPVTITAHDGAHSPVDAAGETINLSVSQGKGIWSRVLSGTGTLSALSMQANTGAASYTFPPGESQVTLLLNYPVDTGETASVNINVLGTVSQKAEIEDPVLQIADAGLQFYNETDGTPNFPIPTQIAGKPSNQFAGDKLLSIRAVRSSDSDPLQCVPLFDENRTLNIEFAAECKDPGSCAANLDPQDPEVFTVNNNPIVLRDNNSVDGATLPYTTIPLTFDVPQPGDAPRANIVLNYTDVGLMQLHTRFNIPFGYFGSGSLDDPQSPPATAFVGGGFSNEYMTGASNEFVVRPFGFVVDFQGANGLDRAAGLPALNYPNRAVGGATANSCASIYDDNPNDNVTACGEAGESDTVFVYAGEGFTTIVAAVGWQAVDDQNNDGQPDYIVDGGNALIRSAANLHDNRVAPNFFNDSAGVDGDYRVDINVIYNEAESQGGIRAADQLLSNQFTKSAFLSSGYGSRVMEYREVGVIDLRAELVNNLAGGGRPALGAPIDYTRTLLGQSVDTVDTLTQGRVLHVGRFYPERFDASLPSLTPRADLLSCTNSSFTYMDEPFALGLRLNAMSADNTATLNYRGAFARLGTYSQLGLTGAITDGNDLQREDRLSNVNFANGSPATFLSSWSSGQIDLSGQVKFVRQQPSAAPDGPFENVTIATLPNDSDFVTIGSGQRTTTILDGQTSANYYSINNLHDFRYGRVLINNAFGSELEDLVVTLRAEYFDGERFVTNTEDSCTILSSSALTFVTSPITTFTGTLSTSPTLDIDDNDTSVFLEGQIQGVQSQTPTDAPFVVIAPGEGFTGTVDIELDLNNTPGLILPWLQFKWPHDDQDYYENPRATLEFGQFRSHDRVINWQEIYNSATP